MGRVVLRAVLPFGAVSLALVALGRGDVDLPAASAAPTPGAYTLVQDVTTANFSRMVDFAMIPGTSGQEAVVITQDALLRRVSLTGAFPPALYGDLSDRVKTVGNEEGLLSLAFSPNFLADNRVYVYYTSLVCAAGVSRCSRISRFPVVNNDMIEGSEVVVLEINQRLNATNHNGGRLLFGPEGYLYLSIGDGGGGGDPLETGQDNSDLLGSVLRIDVTGQATYSVPPDNPFVGQAGADEVWAYGLRNPWRYSFDSLTGDLWLADVGQSTWEEVEEVAKGGNYGWDCYEGNAVYETADCPAASELKFPRAVYDHSQGCSVTGGYVYRGASLAEIYGWYVYGDYCSGKIWAVNPADNSDPVLLVDTAFAISSLAELPSGELLALTFNNAIYRLSCSAQPDSDGDGVGNACDGDDDNDGSLDSIENHAGTNPLQFCSLDFVADNEEPDARPADLNDDRQFTGADLSRVAADLGGNVPPAPVRKDIAPDPAGDNSITGADLSEVAAAIGTAC